MHLISQLLQIRSAWWLASMFPLWMQINSRTPSWSLALRVGLFCIGQDRLSFVLAVQLCDASTLPLPGKEENALFSLGSDLSDAVPYLRVIFPVLKTFLLSFLDQACAGIHPALHAVCPRWACCKAAATSDRGRGWPRVFLPSPGVPVLRRSCRDTGPPQEMQPRAALAQNQGGWKQTITFANSRSLLQTVIYNSGKQANNLFYFNFGGRGENKRRACYVTSITTNALLPCLPLAFTLPAFPFSP